MKVFQRFSASITAQINSLVDQIENHEAVANVALNDIREALMNAKFQIKRVQNEQRMFEQRTRELRDEETKWTERALKSRDENQDRAIECARRLKKCREDIQTISVQITEHEALERKLMEDVRHIELRFEELRNKRNTLAARESRAQALIAVSDNHKATDAGGVFERWERQVMRTEVVADPDLTSEPHDKFAAAFKSEEERVELEELLKNLK